MRLFPTFHTPLISTTNKTPYPHATLPPFTTIRHFGAFLLHDWKPGSVSGRILKPTQALPQGFAKMLHDSLQPAWFDSAQFNHILRETIQERLLSSDIRMFGSKSAPPAPPPPSKKAKDIRKSAELNEIGVEYASQIDSMKAMDILRTRYEVEHLSDQELVEFNQLYSILLADRRGWDDYRWLHSVHYFPPVDSSLVLAKLKYGPQHLPKLSEREKLRFKSVMDSLTRSPMIMSSKTVILISSADTIQAIKIVKAEKHPK